jgi:ribosomal protein S7
MSIFIEFTKQKQLYKAGHNYWYHLWFLYHSVFFGSLIFRGRKLAAFKFLKFIKFDIKLKSLKKDPFLIFLCALVNVTPKVFLRQAYISGTSSGVPVPITEKKQVTFAVK